MLHTKGFVTIATGEKGLFLELACNLKRTYDYQQQSQRYPWAIITDHNDDKWKIFDKVVILNDATCSYLDKIKMLSIPPWEDNIFIDADSLIYGDVSHLFSCFPMSGVRHIGDEIPLDANGKGWFDKDDIGEYKNKISFKIHSHGGIIFFSKDSITKSIFDTAMTITEHWYDYHFREFNNPADEPVLALSMCVHNCPPLPLEMEKILCFYRVERNIKKININKGILSYRNKWNGKLYKQVPIIHWGTNETKGYLYKSEMARFDHSKFYLAKKTIWICHDKIHAFFYILKAYLYRFYHFIILHND